MKRTTTLYLLIVIAATAAIIWLLRVGAALPVPVGLPATATAPAPAADTSAVGAMVAGISKNSAGPLSHLFLQLVVVIAASRLVGRVFTRFGQPAVVGEMAAGILLGPSLFGLLAPGESPSPFPPRRSVPFSS